jgi:hypothetical protein
MTLSRHVDRATLRSVRSRSCADITSETWRLPCCDNDLIAPERSEYRHKRQIVHLWHCLKCDCCFEVVTLAGTKSIKDIMAMIEDSMTGSDIFPSRLAAWARAHKK